MNLSLKMSKQVFICLSFLNKLAADRLQRYDYADAASCFGGYFSGSDQPAPARSAARDYDGLAGRRLL